MGHQRRGRGLFQRFQQGIDGIGGAGVFGIFRRARRDSIGGERRKMRMVVVELQGFLELSLQAFEEKQRTAEEEDVPLDLAPLRKPRDRLVNDRLENGGGKIINIASMLSFLGGYTVAAYAASKGGVAQLTKALSNEWAGKNININALAPGYMATALNTAIINDPVRSKEILDRIPARRWGQPGDMKGAVIFLASGASDYLNGAIIPVDGGFLSR